MTRIENISNQVKGDDLTIITTVKSGGVVYDVSGSTSLLTIKASYSDLDAAALSQSSGTLVTDGTDGKIEFNAPSTDLSSAVSGTDYYYDIQVTLSSGRKYTIVRGVINFVDEVTLS